VQLLDMVVIYLCIKFHYRSRRLVTGSAGLVRQEVSYIVQKVSLTNVALFFRRFISTQHYRDVYYTAIVFISPQKFAQS